MNSKVIYPLRKRNWWHELSNDVYQFKISEKAARIAEVMHDRFAPHVAGGVPAPLYIQIGHVFENELLDLLSRADDLLVDPLELGADAIYERYAYLIDPYEHEVSIVEYDGRREDEWRKINKYIDAVVFDGVCISRNRDYLFVDDEGLFGDKANHIFKISTYPQPLVGKALLCGPEVDEVATNPTFTIDEVRDMVTWYAVQEDK